MADEMAAAVAGEPARRWKRSARREQLLDVAAQMLIELGGAGLTMERLAERAGVSKALPYSHFTNAEDVIDALFRRETGYLGEQITVAQNGLVDSAARVGAAVHAYLDVVEERGTILAALLGARTGGASRDGQDDIGEQFVTDFLAGTFGLTGPAALVAAASIHGTLAGAVLVWARGGATRTVTEETVTTFVLAGLRGIAERP